jgi:4-hydroxybenzoate polyprenyltransferase
LQESEYITICLLKGQVFLEKAISTRDDQRENVEFETSPTPAVDPVQQQKVIGDRLRALLRALRPRQWSKNLAVFVGVLFAQRLFDLLAFERAFLAFIAFCLASSGIYLFNDLLDLDQDRQHPVKRTRPLASGKLPISWAITAISALAVCCSGTVLFISAIPLPDGADIFAAYGGANLLFAITIIGYVLLMALYTIRLKHVVLIDVFIIASGFVLRILAGALVVPVSISPWLYMVTCLLALFLALSKRRHELILLQGQASQHRQILKEYSIPMLDQMITIVVAATIMAYSLYTFQGPTGNHRLIITVPLVLYGIFRYLYLVYMRMEGGSPEEVLLRDRHMFVTVLLCTILIISVL